MHYFVMHGINYIKYDFHSEGKSGMVLYGLTL